MAEEEVGAPPFGRRLRVLLRSHRLFLSVVVFVLGIVMIVLAVGDFTPVRDLTPFPQINSVTDTSEANYNLVFVIAGPIIFLIGAYFVGTYYLARRKFEHLMVTKSKAEFIRNLPELEDLLWDLTPNDELRYSEKKSELRIRR
jgi:hypothetical protein